jgi:hypothetical protein
VIDRAAIRAAFAVLLEANGAWQVVYQSQPKSFGGQSPVATLHNAPLTWEALAAGWAPDMYQAEIWLTNYVRRGPDDDSDTAESALDTLLAAAMAVVAANRTSVNWTELTMLPPTEPDYVMVDGVQYRAERMRLQFTVRE